MEKYFFEQDNGICKQKCFVKNNGTKIGSIACQQCKYCKDYDKDIHGDTTWVVCEKLSEAVGKLR